MATNITANTLDITQTLNAGEVKASDLKIHTSGDEYVSVKDKIGSLPEQFILTVNNVGPDEHGNVEVQVGGSDSFIYTDPSTGDRFEVFGKKLPHPDDGSEQYPWKISTVQDLLNLKSAVEGTASEDNPYRADHFYKQTADISLYGQAWTGIGLLADSYSVDTQHSFKGTYDGNGYAINDMTLHVDSSVAEGTTNRYLALFRAVNGATIKNLTVEVEGLDAMAADDVTAAAIVGLVNGGATLVNCTATGNLGTNATPVVHMTGGVVCRVVNPTDSTMYDNPLVLENVTNRVNIVCARKVGGIVASCSGKVYMTNVVNEGNITKTGTKSGDSIGGLIGYTDTNPHSIFVWNGVKNTGTISTRSDDKTAGQLMGTWHVETDPSTSTGDIAVLDSSMPLSTTCPTTGKTISNMLPVFFGELGSDGLLHCVSSLENGKTYVYLVGNISEYSNAVDTPPAYTLSSGSTITVEQRFGEPNIVDENGVPIVGQEISSATKTWTYTA